jgi:ElaB/YqjD/DUF883 family membrane-anchored ribosome-binding protein
MSFNMQSRGDSPRTDPQYSSQLATMAVRGAGQLLDLQMAAVRTLLQTQARTAAAMGLPDYSGWFSGETDDRMRQVFSKSTEQLAQSAQRAGETLAQIQRHVSHIVETQNNLAAQNLQQGLEHLSTQADESLNQLCATAQRQAEEFERTARSLAESTRDTMRESSERMRDQIQQSGQRVRDLSSQAGQGGQSAAAAQQPAEPQQRQGGSGEDRKRERVAG